MEYPSGGELDLGFVDVPFALPNLRYEAVKAQAHSRIGWMRSVCNIQHGLVSAVLSMKWLIVLQVSCFEMPSNLLGEGNRRGPLPTNGLKYGSYGGRS